MLGPGWAHTQFSDNFAPLLRARLPLGLEHEDAVEIYYDASITPCLNLTPDLQIIEPRLKKTLGPTGGLNNVNTAIMAGLRVYIRF